MKFLPNRVRIRCQGRGKMCILSSEGGLREKVGDGILFWSAQSPTTVQFLAPRCLTAGWSYTLYISASIHPAGKIKGWFSFLRAIFSVYHQLLWSSQLPQLLRTEKTGSPLTMSMALHEAIGDYFPTSCSSLSSYMLKWGVVQGIVGSNLTFLSKPWELICSMGAFF